MNKNNLPTGAASRARAILIPCLKAGVSVALLALLNQIEFRDIGLSRSRFRIHYLDVIAASSFNSESLRSHNAGATRPGIVP